METTENIFDDTAIIVSDGCCVQIGNAQALDDVTFSIEKGKKADILIWNLSRIEEIPLTIDNQQLNLILTSWYGNKLKFYLN